MSHLSLPGASGQRAGAARVVSAPLEGAGCDTSGGHLGSAPAGRHRLWRGGGAPGGPGSAGRVLRGQLSRHGSAGCRYSFVVHWWCFWPPFMHNTFIS